MQSIYWLGIFVVLLIIEIITLGLTTIWFAGGALVAFAASVLGCGVPVQIALFVAVSVILLIFTKPVVAKHFNKGRIKTNAESLIGEQGVVLVDIDTLNAAGRVRVRRQEWAARTVEPDGKAAEGTVVVVEDIQGVRLIVKVKEG